MRHIDPSGKSRLYAARTADVMATGMICGLQEFLRGRPDSATGFALLGDFEKAIAMITATRSMKTVRHQRISS